MRKPFYRRMCKILSLSLLILQSCQKEGYMEEIEMQNQIARPKENFHAGQLLENPYEIHTFRRAYQKVLDSLEHGNYETGKGFASLKTKDKDTSNIRPNYLYIKFSPKSDEQENKLMEHNGT